MCAVLQVVVRDRYAGAGQREAGARVTGKLGTELPATRIAPAGKEPQHSRTEYGVTIRSSEIGEVDGGSMGEEGKKASGAPALLQSEVFLPSLDALS